MPVYGNYPFEPKKKIRSFSGSVAAAECLVVGFKDSTSAAAVTGRARNRATNEHVWGATNLIQGPSYRPDSPATVTAVFVSIRTVTTT
ncbi:hypothetical protein QTP88_019132 [Uroleucon formosanum]